MICAFGDGFLPLRQMPSPLNTRRPFGLRVLSAPYLSFNFYPSIVFPFQTCYPLNQNSKIRPRSPVPRKGEPYGDTKWNCIFTWKKF